MVSFVQSGTAAQTCVRVGVGWVGNVYGHALLGSLSLMTSCCASQARLAADMATERAPFNAQPASPGPGLPRRLHLYGDIYSSPGLDMRRKQLLTCAFLSEAGMPDQLFGHALAGLRYAPGHTRQGRVASGDCRRVRGLDGSGACSPGRHRQELPLPCSGLTRDRFAWAEACQGGFSFDLRHALQAFSPHLSPL